MSLEQQLTDMKVSFLKKVPDNIQTMMANATQTLADLGITEQAPQENQELLNFNLPNQNGEIISLDKLLDKGPAIITFYRGGWCPYCNLELRAYQEALTDIKAAGASLVAITPELPDSSLSTSEKNQLEFEVLTDESAEYAKKIGLVFSLPEELRPIYKSFGIDIEKHNGSGQFDLPLAATFIVNQNRKIVKAFVDVDYTKRLDPAKIVAALQEGLIS